MLSIHDPLYSAVHPMKYVESDVMWYKPILYYTSMFKFTLREMKNKSIAKNFQDPDRIQATNLLETSQTPTKPLGRSVFGYVKPGMYYTTLASFPGLPRSSPLVCVQYNTRKWKSAKNGEGLVSFIT